MTHRNLAGRIQQLEERRPHLPKAHRVLVKGESDSAAIAHYEAKHGPISPDDLLILRVIV